LVAVNWVLWKCPTTRTCCISSLNATSRTIRVDYVAGKVTKVELIQPDATYMKLPEVTRVALFKVIELLTGGKLGWLVHKPGYKEADADPAVKKMEEQAALENKLPDDQSEARKRKLSINEKLRLERQRSGLDALSPDIKELGLQLLTSYDWAVDRWAGGKGNAELIGILDQKMKPIISEVNEMKRLRGGKSASRSLVAADDPTPIFALKSAIEDRQRLLGTKV
jgi:hypothetical protein